MSALPPNLLKDVSRSFYVSMRVLPKPMRDPISLGYLLARASDTLADTESLHAELRMEMLLGMREILEGGERGRWLKRVKSEVIPQQTHRGEQVLLRHIDEVFQSFDSLESNEHRQSIFDVMNHILHGQTLDIERFELSDDFLFTDDAQLEEYCYLVAGCVGEFWTEIGYSSLPSFSKQSEKTLKSWGGRYGRGLQLINILRDLPNDIKVGRCYLPGVDPSDISALMEASAHWRLVARQYLQDGVSYAQSLRMRRTRLATMLPAKIGEQTLNLMDDADWESLSRGVKIKRKDVYFSALSILFRGK